MGDVCAGCPSNVIIGVLCVVFEQTMASSVSEGVRGPVVCHHGHGASWAVRSRVKIGVLCVWLPPPMSSSVCCVLGWPPPRHLRLVICCGGPSNVCLAMLKVGLVGRESTSRWSAFHLPPHASQRRDSSEDDTGQDRLVATHRAHIISPRPPPHHCNSPLY